MCSFVPMLHLLLSLRSALEQTVRSKRHHTGPLKLTQVLSCSGDCLRPLFPLVVLQLPLFSSIDDDAWTLEDLEKGAQQQILKALEQAPKHLRDLADKTLGLRVSRSTSSD